jgi:hypothetical protein
LTALHTPAHRSALLCSALLCSALLCSALLRQQMEQLLKQDDTQSARLHELAQVKEKQLHEQIQELKALRKKEEKKAKKAIALLDAQLQDMARYSHHIFLSLFSLFFFFFFVFFFFKFIFFFGVLCVVCSQLQASEEAVRHLQQTAHSTHSQSSAELDAAQSQLRALQDTHESEKRNIHFQYQKLVERKVALLRHEFGLAAASATSAPASTSTAAAGGSGGAASAVPLQTAGGSGGSAGAAAGSALGAGPFHMIVMCCAFVCVLC